MKEIVRTVEQHVIKGIEIKYEGGQVVVEELKPLEVTTNTMTPEKALKMLKQKYGKNKHIELQEVVSQKYKVACPYDVFMANARIITDEEIKGDVE
ncbi:hypothetical protein OUHCRE14_45850 [Enterobacter hormaechei subsp. hoffmannii]